jgi:ATP synthase F1 complex assembly factor 1
MERLARRAAPQFVLPVPHEGEGAELHFLQWTFGSPPAAAAATTPAIATSTVLFTRLAEYKLHGEFAQPHTTVTHHVDLAAERGLVLMEGAVVDGRGASVDQAHWLVMCLQRFYGALGDAEVAAGAATEPEEVARGRRNRRQLVEWFGRGDPRFSVEALLEESQRVG